MNPITCRIRVLPVAHELQVEIRLEPVLGRQNLLLQFPSWVPGSYRFRPYARNIFDLKASDANTGASLAVIRVGWQGFQITGVTGPVCITYQVWAYDLASSQACGLVEDNFAVLTGTHLPFLPEYPGPYRLTLDLPLGWHLHHTGGYLSGFDRRVLHFSNYEDLIDSPLIVGHFDRFKRQIGSAQFYFVFLDRALGFNTEVDAFLERLTEVARQCALIFGGFPFSTYTFILTTRPDLRWGLEHDVASLCGLGPDVFIDPICNSRAVRVCAHELFHAWNVRRLRPFPLDAPANLIHGTFTEGLWLAEGFTRYYEFLLCTRARIYSIGQFFSSIVNNWNHLVRTPAYRRVSAVDSSLATFLNHQSYPGSANTSIDYYQKGMLIAFDLDARLRVQGGSVDEVMRKLFRFSSQSHQGYTTKQVIELVKEENKVAGRTLEREVLQPGGLSVFKCLKLIGFKPHFVQTCTLGLAMKSGSGEVAAVLDGGAGSAGGVSPGDIITAIAGFEFSNRALEWAAKHPPKICLTVVRGNRLRSIVALPRPVPKIGSLEWQGTAQQGACIASWMARRRLCPESGYRMNLEFYENFHGEERFV